MLSENAFFGKNVHDRTCQTNTNSSIGGIPFEQFLKIPKHFYKILNKLATNDDTLVLFLLTSRLLS